MSTVYLIVETPRGGDLGHRFLSSPGHGVESEIAILANEANRNLIGSNYIAVSQTVRQTLANGTIRNGTECIILAGIDMPAIQGAKQDQVIDQLNQLFPKLDNLIKSINWSLDNRSTVIVCKELQSWLDHEAFRDLPAAKTITPPQGSTQIRWLYLLGAITIALVVFFYLYPIIPTRLPETAEVSEPNLPEKQLNTLTKEWACNQDDVFKSLLIAKNWDRRRENITLPQALINSDVLEMLELVNKEKVGERFRASQSLIKDEGLVQFAKKLSLTSDKQCKAFRANLYSVWKGHKELKKKTQGINDHGLVQDDDLYLKLLLLFSKYPDGPGFGDHFAEPKTPLLDQQDLMIYKFLDDVRTKTEFQVLLKKNDQDLFSFLKSFQSNQTSTIEGLLGSRKNICDKIRNDSKGNPNKEEREKKSSAMNDSYEALEIFFESVSKVNICN